MQRRLIPILIASTALAAPLAAQEAAPAADTTHAILIRAMKADLRSLVQQQKLFFARRQRYADSTSLVHFTPATRGVLRILSAGPDGWSGVLTAAEPGVSCGVYVGAAVAPNAAVLADGEPGCWYRRRDGLLVGV